MADMKNMKPLSEPTQSCSDTDVKVNFCDTVIADHRKRNLETLLWLGMEIDGPGRRGAANRNLSLQFCNCRTDRKK
jgi:hypothetical protein